MKSLTLRILLIVLALVFAVAVVILGGYNRIAFYGIQIFPLALALLYFYRRHKKFEATNKISEPTDWKARFAKTSIFPKAITVFFLLLSAFVGSACLGFGGEAAGWGCITGFPLLFFGAFFILLLWLIALAIAFWIKRPLHPAFIIIAFIVITIFFYVLITNLLPIIIGWDKPDNSNPTPNFPATQAPLIQD